MRSDSDRGAVTTRGKGHVPKRYCAWSCSLLLSRAPRCVQGCSWAWGVLEMGDSVYDEVEIEDMDFDKVCALRLQRVRVRSKGRAACVCVCACVCNRAAVRQGKNTFYYPCPCGDKFQISIDELLDGEGASVF